jgi:hypothetical protein
MHKNDVILTKKTRRVYLIYERCDKIFKIDYFRKYATLVFLYTFLVSTFAFKKKNFQCYLSYFDATI